MRKRRQEKKMTEKEGRKGKRERKKETTGNEVLRNQSASETFFFWDCSK